MLRDRVAWGNRPRRWHGQGPPADGASYGLVGGAHPRWGEILISYVFSLPSTLGGMLSRDKVAGKHVWSCSTPCLPPPEAGEGMPPTLNRYPILPQKRHPRGLSVPGQPFFSIAALFGAVSGGSDPLEW